MGGKKKEKERITELKKLREEMVREVVSSKHRFDYQTVSNRGGKNGVSIFFSST